MSKEKIREEIREKISQYLQEEKKERKFTAGKSKVQYAGIVYDETEVCAMVDAILDGWFGVGRNARSFEVELSDYLGAAEAVLANSGSSANLLAMAALMSREMPGHLNPGDEVITPATTFPTTINPVFQNGLKPVVVDVDLGTYNLTPQEIEEALSDRTRAIFLLHQLGNPCRMEEIMAIAKRHKLFVIEDNCDALGAKYNGKPTGTFGDISTLSFYVAHHISMGEGGAVVTNNRGLAKTVRSLRDWGRACSCPVCEVALNPHKRCERRFKQQIGILPQGYDTKYVYTNLGYNLKPLELQAAMGRVQLGRLEEFIRKRNKNFALLYELFSCYEEFFVLPRVEEGAEPSWFAFPLTIRDGAPFFRSELIQYLEESNIETRLLFAGNILRHPAYQGLSFRIVGSLPNAEKVMRDSFFLGVYPGIDEGRMDYIIKQVKGFMAKYK